jgi:TatD DNase family protein
MQVANAPISPNQPVELWDTHAHLDFSDFAGDFAGVLERARAAGVARIISIGTDLPSSRRAIALAEQYDFVYAVAGWHPSHADTAPDDIREELRSLAAHPKVVAIGETGLDYHRLPEDPVAAAELKVRQRELFEQQLEVAESLGLNCVIHERDAFEDVFATLTPWFPRLRTVFHCYVNTLPNALRIIEAGSLVSFTGIVTFKNAEQVRDVVRGIPEGKFMVETDCPCLAPMPHRGKRAEPAHVRLTTEKLAEVRGIPVAQISAMTCATAREFFPKVR